MKKRASEGGAKDWTQFKFTSYDVIDLEECATRFKADVAQIWQMEDSEAWTEFVLDWFVAAAPSGYLANARPGRGGWQRFAKSCGIKLEHRGRETVGASEWMLDLAHSTYSIAGDKAYWRRQLDGDLPCTMQLAMEVEWGGRDDVLDDASKVAAVRAEAKVIVTGVRAHVASDMLRDLTKLRMLTEDTVPWLWINLPSSDDSKDCVSRVLAAAHRAHDGE
jgi:hypothetical protein